jgi:hypothetical protein
MYTYSVYLGKINYGICHREYLIGMSVITERYTKLFIHPRKEEVIAMLELQRNADLVSFHANKAFDRCNSSYMQEYIDYTQPGFDFEREIKVYQDEVFSIRMVLKKNIWLNERGSTEHLEDMVLSSVSELFSTI